MGLGRPALPPSRWACFAEEMYMSGGSSSWPPDPVAAVDRQLGVHGGRGGWYCCFSSAPAAAPRTREFGVWPGPKFRNPSTVPVRHGGTFMRLAKSRYVNGAPDAMWPPVQRILLVPTGTGFVVAGEDGDEQDEYVRRSICPSFRLLEALASGS